MPSVGRSAGSSADSGREASPTVPTAPFRVVQPWGPDKARQSTLISEHVTAEEAFAFIERFAEQAARTGAQSDAVELVVVDAEGRLVARASVH